MNQQFPVRTIAGCFALAAFSVAIISGLGAGRGTNAVIQSALIVLLLGQMAGYLFGHMLRAAIRENLLAFEQANPIPSEQPNGEGGPAINESSPPEVEALEIAVESEDGS